MIGQALSEQRLQVSCLLWGREGTGKTTSALRLTQVGTGRVLLINAEAGAKRHALATHGIDASRVDVWPTEDQGPGHITYATIEAEVLEPLRRELEANPGSYTGVVIDSFTELARRVLEDVVAEATAKAARLGKARDQWQVDLADHGVAASQMRSLLRRFRDLPVHLFITALERRDVDQNSGMVMYGPALGPAVAVDTMGLVDLVGFCQVEEIGGQEFRTATFTPTSIRRGKDRYGVMPQTLVDPFADRIVDYIAGELTRDNDPGRARVLAAIKGSQVAEVAETVANEPNIDGAGPSTDTTDGASASTESAEKENA